jgi:hypothetical protein
MRAKVAATKLQPPRSRKSAKPTAVRDCMATGRGKMQACCS